MHHLCLPPFQLRLGAFALTAIAVAFPAQAQVDAGQILRETQQQQQRRELPTNVPQKVVESKAAPSGPTVVILEFDIEGARRYDKATLQAVVEPLRGQALDFAGLQGAADRIAERYRRDGWHAGVFLPEQDLKSGVLKILVVESTLGRIKAEGADALPRNTPRRQIDRYLASAAPKGQALNLDALARATAIANELPGSRVSTVLARGENAGETDVLLRIDPRPLVAGSISVDNHDSISTGAEKATAVVSLVSPFALGESFDILGSKSRGKRFARGAASLPVGSDGWRLGAAVSGLSYRLVGDAALAAGTGQPNGAKGSASTVGLTASYPLVRKESFNANLVLAVDYRATRNETFLGITSDKRVKAATLTLQADQVDSLFGGGANSGSIVLTRGDVDLSRNAGDLNADQLGPRTHGSFTKWSLTASRLQRVTDEHLVYAGINAQHSAQNLDAGEKFSLGGPLGVRAYPLLEASGDSGAVATVAWRWILNGLLPGQFRVEAFVDAGWVRRTQTLYNGAPLPNEYVLKGAGIGADWNPTPLSRLNLQIADRIGRNPAPLANGRDNDGSHRRPRVWFSAMLAF